MSFSAIIRIIFLCLLLISVLVGRRVVNWTTAFGRTDVERRWWRIGTWAFLFLLNLPAFYILMFGLVGRGSTDQRWQLYFLYPYFAWQITAMLMAVLLSIRAIVTIPSRLWKLIRKPASDQSSIDQSRRDFLAKTATAIPAGLLLTTGYGIVNAQADFDWFEHDLKLRDWPKELEGLRVIQISDMHVGSFMPGEKLGEYIEAVNERKPEMLMITGDIINNNRAWLPETLEAMGKIKLPPYGAFVCIGNHDYYAGCAEELMTGLQQMGMTVVRDRNVTVPVRDAKINMAGIEYPRGGMHFDGSDRFTSHVERALDGADPDAPTLLLAHHPHAFDPAAERGVQLTLSGHTHGGQFAFKYPGGSVSMGDLMFKYVAGLYQRGDAHLYVNRGIGNWFPMRLGAPPEVTLLHLS